MLDVLERSTFMNRIQRALGTIVVMLAVVISGCSDRGAGEKQEPERPTVTRGEHDRDGGEHDGEGGHDRDGEGHHGEEGEESGIELSLDETYDKVRNGARLVLAYDVQSNSFIGTVENTTYRILKQVRVEVHLSNGKELGPTTPGDLGPGERRAVKLTATSRDFDGWTAHPEVGIGEVGHGEGPGEHDREGRSEH
jgi:hypothetical protein